MKPPRAVASWLKKIASQLPGAREGLACAGTSLESITWASGKAVFVFAGLSKGVVSMRVKLKASAAEARKLAKAQPTRFAMGASGWATVKWDQSEKAPEALLKSWIIESYRLVALPRSTDGA